MAYHAAKGAGRRPSIQTTPASASPASEAPQLPEFIRLPKAGRQCQWTGLSRGSLNDLILGPGAPVKSVVIVQPGASRGIRLIHLASLLDHLHARMAEQEQIEAGSGKEVENDG